MPPPRFGGEGDWEMKMGRNDRGFEVGVFGFGGADRMTAGGRMFLASVGGGVGGRGGGNRVGRRGGETKEAFLARRAKEWMELRIE